ncbi:MAG: hypothetical protein EOP62_18340 [Sphingomonadales bacterium]|nr:MAG: hypothetical protein EOP62_18340 [Sphingomonadales bacterium]
MRGCLVPRRTRPQNLPQQYQDILIFYRMGDFYELFFQDAEIAAKELGIILTKKQLKNNSIPMCGVPHHSYESYAARLITAGYKVGICEQLETPEEAKKRGGYKAVIKREVVRIITKGTLTEDSMLPSDDFNYLAAIHKTNNEITAESHISARCRVRRFEFLANVARLHDANFPLLLPDFDVVRMIQPEGFCPCFFVAMYAKVSHSNDAVARIKKIEPVISHSAFMHDLRSVVRRSRDDRSQRWSLGIRCAAIRCGAEQTSFQARKS